MADTYESIEALIAVLERPKRMISMSWMPPEKNGQRGFKLKSALDADSATIRGITLEIGCHREGFDLPSRVVLMAEINKKPRAMARIDINGSLHENTKAICGEWQGRCAGHTHFHDIRLHRGISFDELFNGQHGDLPVAVPIDDMPSEFCKAMEKCGELLYVDNLGEIEEPQWQPRQFPF